MAVPTEVFLSHSSNDREQAERIAKTLRAHDVPVWFSQHNIVGAAQWHDEIGNALRRCDWFAVLLSPEAVGSLWVRRELHYALREQRYENHIIPLHYLPCDPDGLSWTLSGFQMVDFSAAFTRGCEALLRVWDLELDDAKVVGEQTKTTRRK